MSSPELHLHSTMTHNGALESIANAATDIAMFDWQKNAHGTRCVIADMRYLCVIHNC